jgi:hypothetical protein
MASACVEVVSIPWQTFYVQQSCFLYASVIVECDESYPRVVPKEKNGSEKSGNRNFEKTGTSNEDDGETSITKKTKSRKKRNLSMLETLCSWFAVFLILFFFFLLGREIDEHLQLGLGLGNPNPNPNPNPYPKKYLQIKILQT